MDPQATEAWEAFGKLLRAARTVLARVELQLSASGLTTTQFGVLEVIWHNGPLTQRELSRKVLTSPGNMTDVVDKLEVRGLVHRARQPTDRRAIQVELTTAGTDLIEPLFTQYTGELAAAMTGLTQQELRQLNGLLAKLLSD